MKLELADLATNESQLLKGFKVAGVFPFHLKYIRTDTHIQLCKIREQINLVAPDEANLADYYNSDLQSKIIPLINKYCVTALVNNRPFQRLFKFLLRRKIKACSHYHILNLYLTIHKLNEPAFFLSYWRLIKAPENTLLKVETQS